MEKKHSQRMEFLSWERVWDFYIQGLLSVEIPAKNRKSLKLDFRYFKG